MPIPRLHPKEDMMKVQDAMRGYDYDLPLKDVLNDTEVADDRRVLAGATIGVGLDTAYFAISQLEEAYATLANILNDRSPFQMRLWYLLYDTPIDVAQEQLAWLKSLTYRRGRMAKVMRDEKLAVTYATDAALCEGVTAAQVMERLGARG
jgi:hypothetical protein